MLYQALKIIAVLALLVRAATDPTFLTIALSVISFVIAVRL